MASRRSGIGEQFAAWRELLKTRDFGWLWSGQVISQIGDGLTKVALLWFVYNLTGSALKMTIIGVLQTVPPLILGPIAGVYLDRLPKRGAMIVIDVVRAALLVVIPVLYMMGSLSLGWLYVVVFVIAVFSMAFGPALNAAIPLLVKKHQLTRANAIMQSSMTIGQLLGPAISGMLIAVIGAQNVLYVNAATFVVSALCKIPIKIRKDADGRHAGSSKALLDDLRAGFRFVFVQHRLLLVLMTAAALFTLGSTGFVYLLPVIGERVLHTDSVSLGWLWSALSAGILLTTVWLALMKQEDLCRRLWIILGASVVCGLAVFGLNWTGSLIAAAGLIVVIGGSSGLVTPIVSASLQEMTPKDLLARVFSVFNTGTMALAMLGMTVFGWAADRYGPLVSLTSIGSVLLATAIVTFVMIPRCRRLSKSSGAAMSHA
jgi:MFS transporter, DHA3 family, macrolide efflux protein